MTNSRGFFSEGGQTAEQTSFAPNPRNLEAEWGPAQFDVRRSLTVAGVAVPIASPAESVRARPFRGGSGSMRPRSCCPAPVPSPNAGVGIVRAPTLRVIDLSVAKQIAVASQRSLELRAEAFNVLNTPGVRSARQKPDERDVRTGAQFPARTRDSTGRTRPLLISKSSFTRLMSRSRSQDAETAHGGSWLAGAEKNERRAPRVLPSSAHW